jgi:2-phosphosulfolactate phosphatase
VRVAVQPVPDAASLRAGTSCAIVDVLRATTTLTVAFSNGAARVLPAVSPEEAFALAETQSDPLLCGERDGRKLPGFALGNSPFEYETARVQGRTLIFASTNGSRAMRSAARAKRRVLAAFVNASAVIEALAGAPHVTVVCSGKDGRFALEDLACAGWLVRAWRERGAAVEGDAARLALSLSPRDPAEAAALVANCAHARELAALGPDYARDVAFCAGHDTLPGVFEI